MSRERVLRRIAAIDHYLRHPTLQVSTTDATLLTSQRKRKALASVAGMVPAGVAAVTGLSMGVSWLAAAGAVAAAFFVKQLQQTMAMDGPAWSSFTGALGSDLVTDFSRAIARGSWLRVVASIFRQEETSESGAGAIIPEILPGKPGIQAGRLHSFGTPLVCGQMFDENNVYVVVRAPMAEAGRLEPFAFFARRLTDPFPNTKDLIKKLRVECLRTWENSGDVEDEEVASNMWCEWYGRETTDVASRVATSLARLCKFEHRSFIFYGDGKSVTWILPTEDLPGIDSVAAMLSGVFGKMDSPFAEIIAWERRSLLKNHILLHVLQRHLADVKLQTGSGILPASYFDSGLDLEDEVYGCEDHLTGRFRGQWMEIYEVAATKTRRDLYIVTAGNVGVRESVLVLTKDSVVRTSKPLIESAWEGREFSQMFSVFCADEVDARLALPISLQERIVKVHRKIGSALAMAVRDDHVYIVLRHAKDLFEPRFDVQETEALFESQVASLLDLVAELKR